MDEIQAALAEARAKKEALERELARRDAAALIELRERADSLRTSCAALEEQANVESAYLSQRLDAGGTVRDRPGLRALQYAMRLLTGVGGVAGMALLLESGIHIPALVIVFSGLIPLYFGGNLADRLEREL